MITIMTMNDEFQPPSEAGIIELLSRVQNIAVIGLSPKANRPSYQVSSAMQSFGYRIIPVRPAVSEVLGETAYAHLRDVTERIDLVNVFRALEHVDEIVDTCIELNIPAIWLQDGVINEAAAIRAQQAGIEVIMDRCIYRDYMNFM